MGATCTLNMTDSFGDGWHGGYVTVNGVQYGSSFTSGYSFEFEFTVDSELELELILGGGGTSTSSVLSRALDNPVPRSCLQNNTYLILYGKQVVTHP